MRSLPILATLPLLSAVVAAQQTILMTSGTSDERTLAVDAPETDLIRGDEIYSVTPLPGVSYTARPFLPISLQWFYVGDQDGDALYVDASTTGPGGDIDAIFVKQALPNVVGPRDVYFSIASTNANLPNVASSDVVRYAGQGQLEYFLRESDLQVGVGGSTLNLDALCQSPTGDLFFSFSLTETLSIGSAADGDLLMIPSTAITYDANGNVTAIVPNSVMLVATESELIALVNNSGFRTSVGGTVTTSFELSGLEIDPNGGVFNSVATPGLVVPNLLFVWNDFSNDGAIVSTANNGSLAVINGVTMGSTVATQGDQIGWLPDSTGTNGPSGLALTLLQPPPYRLLNYPRNLITSGSGQTLLQFEVSGGTPNGGSLLALSIESAVPNGAFSAFAAPSPAIGELGLTNPILLGIVPHDALGNGQSPLLVLPTTGLSGTNVAAQAIDVTTLALSTPTGFSFL